LEKKHPFVLYIKRIGGALASQFVEHLSRFVELLPLMHNIHLEENVSMISDE
jgi:hypothetical protein